MIQGHTHTFDCLFSSLSALVVVMIMAISFRDAIDLTGSLMYTLDLEPDLGPGMRTFGANSALILEHLCDLLSELGMLLDVGCEIAL